MRMTNIIEDENLVPFRFEATDEASADLKRRLEATRWPDAETSPGWAQGVPLAKMQALVEAWRGQYDWRKAEASLNRWPQFKTKIDGLGIHFAHVRSKEPNATPINLTHGWPSSVLLFRDVVAPLTDPTAFGGASADAFDVVIPSLPGFGFSDARSTTVNGRRGLGRITAKRQSGSVSLSLPPHPISIVMSAFRPSGAKFIST
jgi:epoxide hydrolase